MTYDPAHPEIVSRYEARLIWDVDRGDPAEHVLMAYRYSVHLAYACESLASFCSGARLDITRRDGSPVTSGLIRHKLDQARRRGPQVEVALEVTWRMEPGKEVPATLRLTVDFDPPGVASGAGAPAGARAASLT